MGLNSRKGSQHQQDSATGMNAPQLLGYIFCITGKVVARSTQTRNSHHFSFSSLVRHVYYQRGFNLVNNYFASSQLELKR